jgi:hypothetical protein
LNPARCQRTTVSGWTRINATFHPGHSRRKITQNNVGYGKPRLRVPLFQNGKLLPKGQILQEEVAARTAGLNDQIEKKLQRTQHELVVAEASVAAKQIVSGCLCPWLLWQQRRLWQGRQR